MREIKFCGKRVDNGQWVYGQYFITPLTDENSGLPSETGWFFLTGEKKHCIARDGVSFVIDIKTLGQFTGLHDENGKGIYEGDIFVTRGLCTAVVEWEKEGRFLGFTIGGERKIIYINREPKVEVIGNIHDNPELLEVKDV
ncbi:YopX family protein [Desulfosporosinus sp. BG]|uniref:YopX family protein n=1 Tax=Desulfosporosinus sp. BG TaxID=1633135 RepID=UPI00083B63ED|nr:YopX family protein [Desulfosporosinus sp. BG]ODA39303.1 Phage protein [Desulfosporosinus sp. BG]